MAQWLGQFSGRTHATAVRDAEQLLRHAVAALVTAPPADRARKAKAIRALAKRIYAARVRYIKARIFAATEPNIETVSGRAIELARLRAELTTVQTQSLDGILREFQAIADRADSPWVVRTCPTCR
ncbi:MAG TPA: hypothetical protein VHE30_03995 [Polyangiaceae bacterium]|nr:hypothetical protein [Polyangiaceae bacterium]